VRRPRRRTPPPFRLGPGSSLRCRTQTRCWLPYRAAPASHRCSPGTYVAQPISAAGVSPARYRIIHLLTNTGRPSVDHDVVSSASPIAIEASAIREQKPTPIACSRSNVFACSSLQLLDVPVRRGYLRRANGSSTRDVTSFKGSVQSPRLKKLPGDGDADQHFPFAAHRAARQRRDSLDVGRHSDHYGLSGFPSVNSANAVSESRPSYEGSAPSRSRPRVRHDVPA